MIRPSDVKHGPRGHNPLLYITQGMATTTKRERRSGSPTYKGQGQNGERLESLPGWGGKPRTALSSPT
jgi:hypothetical protein